MCTQPIVAMHIVLSASVAILKSKQVPQNIWDRRALMDPPSQILVHEYMVWLVGELWRPLDEGFGPTRFEGPYFHIREWALSAILVLDTPLSTLFPL